MHVLDRELLDHELARRGLTGERLAALAGLSPATVSRLRTGHPGRSATIRAVVGALAEIAPIADAILALPGKENAGRGTIPAGKEDNGAGGAGDGRDSAA